MAKLGRKPSSQIRDNLVELLFFLKESYGYSLYKKYSLVFNNSISIRSIYYHLSKGVELGIFKIQDVQQARGDYSWGDNVQRIIFSLGKDAHPQGSREVYEKICELQRRKELKK